jgi:hypothetical protein
MMMYCETVDFIPHIPLELVDSLMDIETYENVFPRPERVDVYASYVVQQNLQDWAQAQFDYPIAARYQIIKQDLPVHTDVGITGGKYNYLLTTGGTNVKTRWWDSEDDPQTVLHEVVAQTHVWYNLNIDVPHDVVNVTEPRISITIRMK